MYIIIIHLYINCIDDGHTGQRNYCTCLLNDDTVQSQPLRVQPVLYNASYVNLIAGVMMV